MGTEREKMDVAQQRNQGNDAVHPMKISRKYEDISMSSYGTVLYGTIRTHTCSPASRPIPGTVTLPTNRRGSPQRSLPDLASDSSLIRARTSPYQPALRPSTSASLSLSFSFSLPSLSLPLLSSAGRGFPRLTVFVLPAGRPFVLLHTCSVLHISILCLCIPPKRCDVWNSPFLSGLKDLGSKA